ncbi:HAAS signaling domain-containing protein [Streptomyces rubellomurinus]|uniref:HAAS signaling domain-containing protein n=1 Tax=Streptomyces rubellomurinus (strain ATCC 31215) TaxID=359131 RepID=UPI000696B091|nr:hypothetical protein [Streptomyces rubellomurinus]
MSNPTDHPLVRAHLDAVARLTEPLPADQRRELLADLREHVEVALAEAGPTGPADEATVRHVLDQLGSPRQIADAALAEAGPARPEAGGRPEPESSGRTTVTLALAVLPLPLLLVPGVGPVLGLVTAVAAAIRVGRSAQWSRREKKQAALLLLAPLLAVPLAAVLVAALSGSLSPVGVLAACAVGFSPTLLAAARLARSAARLRAATVTA